MDRHQRARFQAEIDGIKTWIRCLEVIIEQRQHELAEQRQKLADYQSLLASVE